MSEYLQKEIALYQEAINEIEGIDMAGQEDFWGELAYWMDNAGEFKKFEEYALIYGDAENTASACALYLKNKIHDLNVDIEDKKYGTEQEQANSDYYASR